MPRKPKFRASDLMKELRHNNKNPIILGKNQKKRDIAASYGCRTQNVKFFARKSRLASKVASFLSKIEE